MKALGLVETKGLLAAVEASDVMLKTAEVTLTQKEVVGGGLVTIMVQGDVAAVKTAVDAAASAVTKLGESLLATIHVIPRPDESLRLFEAAAEVEIETKAEVENPADDLNSQKEEGVVKAESQAANEKPEAETLQEESKEIENDATPASPSQEVTEVSYSELGKAGKTAEIENELSAMKVLELRKLAKKQQNFSINKKDVHKANKEQLIAALMQHFTKK